MEKENIPKSWDVAGINQGEGEDLLEDPEGEARLQEGASPKKRGRKAAAPLQ